MCFQTLYFECGCWECPFLPQHDAAHICTDPVWCEVNWPAQSPTLNPIKHLEQPDELEYHPASVARPH